MLISVIVPAHNPHRPRLSRVLAALASQTLEAGNWEAVLVDNASSPAIEFTEIAPSLRAPLRVLREPRPGLTWARRGGLEASSGELCVFVDDDNVLAPNYLAAAVSLFSARPFLGAAGGPSRPEFEVAPPPWAAEFFPLLALRDLGPAPLFAKLEHSQHHLPVYPACAPIGAGLVLRRTAAQAWLNAGGTSPLTDRVGSSLSSGGDNDIVFSLLRAGWEVAYHPELALTHLIPAARVDPDYLARLNRGIQHSWMEVLTRHSANPWPRVSPWGCELRKAKSFFARRGWRRPAERIRWQGDCGHFEGRRLHSPVDPVS